MRTRIIARSATIVLMSLVMVLLGTAACCGGGIVKPQVGYVPDGWKLVKEDPYGSYNIGGEKFGYMLYEDTNVKNFVMIFYGDYADWQMGEPSDGDNPFARVLAGTMSFKPGDTGIMNVGNRSAGYFKTCDRGSCEMGISFYKLSGWTKHPTWVGIYTLYYSNEEDEAMSLVDSIHF